MEINIDILDNGVKQITLNGRMDLQGATQIEMKFTAHASTQKAGVIVDLAKVPFMSSYGIRVLVSNAKAVRSRGGKMALLNPEPLVAEVLVNTGIDVLIPIFYDLDAACQDVLSAL